MKQARQERAAGRGKATPGPMMFGRSCHHSKIKSTPKCAFLKQIQNFSPQESVSPGPAVALDGPVMKLLKLWILYMLVAFLQPTNTSVS